MIKPSPYLRLLGRQYPTYGVLVVMGYMLGASLFLLLCSYKELSVSIAGLAAVFAMAASWFLGLGIKRIFNQENFVFLHFATCVVLVSGLVIFVFDGQVLAYLDCLTAGILLALAIGRLGCFNAGCCHGRKSRMGVFYHGSHPKAGIRLFPIQLLESLGALIILAFAIQSITAEEKASYTLGWMVLSYGWLRFLLEIFRGDAERPYWLGMSEAQWTILGLTGLVALTLELPFAWLVTYGSLLAFVIIWQIWLQLPAGKRYHLFHPRHIHELQSRLSRMWLLKLDTSNYGPWRSSQGLRLDLEKGQGREWNLDITGSESSELESLGERLGKRLWSRYTMQRSERIADGASLSFGPSESAELEKPHADIAASLSPEITSHV